MSKDLAVKKVYSDEEKLKAAYALNMCTVSVSQIIDYKDSYILEQEYEAILNNLNLKQIPKDEALLRILTELLNTITFFRIQDIKKKQIEKKYQQRMKNAIWSAIPNFSMIISNNPVALGISLATQIGTGYMNYRKEKCNAKSEMEDAEIELEITAIEQLNALRRELFTTAWRLADAYDFEDEWRLTERQIKQYNEILMDSDELRKYVRLEAIQEKFEAFPPFWYFFGHTACSIAEDIDLKLEYWEREEYRRRAKEHFARYEKLNKYNILREDQIAASFALEYVDLLLMENEPNKEKVASLLKTAIEMSGGANDIKELCAISYLKIGQTSDAAKLLMQLVNEDYNTMMNAKLLSRVYTSQFLSGSSSTAKFDYKTLVLRVGNQKASYLFPMPESRIEDGKLQEKYLSEQRMNLQVEYRKTINEFLRKYTIRFNAVFPAPYGYESYEAYYGYTKQAILNRHTDIGKVLNDKHNKDAFLDELKEIGFRFRFLDLLNEAMEACDELQLWRNAESHDVCVLSVRGKLIEKRSLMKKLQDNIECGKFSQSDYEVIQRDLSFWSIMGKMLDDLKEVVVAAIESMDSLDKIQQAEFDLEVFCKKHELVLGVLQANDEAAIQDTFKYLDENIFKEDGIDEKRRRERLNEMRRIAKNVASGLVGEHSGETVVLLPGDERFKLYFENENLNTTASFREKVLLIIDNNTKADCDLVLMEEGVRLIERNKIKELYEYDDIKYSKTGLRGEILKLGHTDEYSNKKVNMAKLCNLLKSLDDVRKGSK